MAIRDRMSGNEAVAIAMKQINLQVVFWGFCAKS